MLNVALSRTLRALGTLTLWALIPAVAVAQSVTQQTKSEDEALQVSREGPRTILGVNPEFFTSTNWCKDTGTLCWTDPAKSWGLTGIRFIGEPNTGGLSQSGENRVENASLVGIIKAGVEVNLVGAIASLQASFIPQSTVTIDTDSELVTANRLANSDRKMGVDYGFTVGLSLINGIIATGYGRLNMDTRRISAPTANEKRIGFFFFNIQPISTIRAAIGGK